MKNTMTINWRRIGPGHPVYIVAEMSANHGQNYKEAKKIIQAAKKAGAAAIKLQTYTPDTMTINCRRKYFRIGKGTIWQGRYLYDLYKEAYTPWEWQPKLKMIAEDLGLDFFSTPFDKTSVDFLEKMDVPAYKIASFELVDIPLLKYVAKTGKPIIMSTGMATLSEIEEAVLTIRSAGNDQICLLKCTSAYPASPQEMNLRTIPHLSGTFAVPAGLSDHSLDLSIPVTAVALGACVIEKHLTLSRKASGPDNAFSLEPNEFETLVEAVHTAEAALGGIQYGASEQEKKSGAFRRSLFAVRDIKVGERFTPENVRTIRPAYGLHPRYLNDVLGNTAICNIRRGTPLSWDIITVRQH